MLGFGLYQCSIFFRLHLVAEKMLEKWWEKKNLNPKFWTEVDEVFRRWIEFSFGCQMDIVALFGLHKLILLGLYIYIHIYCGLSDFLVLVSLLGLCRCSRELSGWVSFLNMEMIAIDNNHVGTVTIRMIRIWECFRKCCKIKKPVDMDLWLNS